jgi:methanogenic corrinoid protein MtbC1
MKNQITEIVLIKDMSAGNETVGESWQETKIFSVDEPITNLLKWAFPDCDYERKSRKRVTITIPEQ